jgi:protein SCO1/2
MKKLLCIAAIMIAASSVRAASPKIPDVTVIDQDGKRSHIYSDLVRGHIVVVNFIFTNCTTICGTMGANFGRLQQLVGRDVQLISISVDPLDNPARLKAWSQRWGRGNHWTLVTGTQGDVDALRKAFGVYSADFVNHSAITFIGNDRTGEWTRVDGLAPAAKIAQRVNSVASGENAR